MLTVVRWGRLSGICSLFSFGTYETLTTSRPDRIGRKPVLMLGLIGSMLATVMFGISTSFSWALMSRAIAGGLSGNVAVLLSAIGDITDSTNEAQSFAFMGFANNIAQIAGFSIG